MDDWKPIAAIMFGIAAIVAFGTISDAYVEGKKAELQKICILAHGEWKDKVCVFPKSEASK